MAECDEQHTRPGSAADLSRRMDRLERNHEDLAASTAREFAQLSGTISRVEQNQTHAEELNKLRFGALDTAVSTLSADLKGFMSRIESLISGETETAAARQGRELVEDYKSWRREITMQVDTLTDSVEKTDAVAAALIKSRQSTGVWVRSVVPWVLSGIGVAVTVINLFNWGA
jgi:hypothetical protein